MIDVRMGQHDRVDVRDRRRQCAIRRLRIAPPALEQSAVERDEPAIDTHEVTRAGHFACGAREFDIHASAVPTCNGP